MAVQIQLRRGTLLDWSNANPVLANGEVGVETDTSRFKIGNGIANWSSLNYYSAMVTGSSYQITSSWSINSVSSSYSLSSSYSDFANSSSYSLTSSFSTTSSYIDLAQTASYITLAQSASYVTLAQTSSYLTPQNSYNVTNLTASNISASGRIIANSFTGSLLGTSSYSNNSISASYSLSSSYSTTSSFSSTASYVNLAQTASYVTLSQTASYVTLAQSASYVNLAQSASFVSLAQSASYVTLAQSSSYLTPQNSYNVTNLTASNISSSSITGSLLGTSSYSNNSTSASYSLSGSYVNFARSSSYSLSSSYTNTSSYAESASYSVTSSYSTTSSYVVLAQTASFVSLSQTSSYLTPQNSYIVTNLSASNSISTSNAFINGNLTVSGSILASIFSASNIYITSSQLIVTDNVITLNALSPYQRYAGIEMYDSGSGALSSILWDSVGDYFLISGSGINSKIIGGPDGQLNLTSGKLTKATGTNIIGDSIVTDNGSGIIVSGYISSSGQVNAGGFTGSLFGTSSWSNNSLTASYFGSGSDNYFPVWSSNKLSFNSLISQSNNQVSILSNTASFLGNTLIINKSDPFYVNNNPTIDASNSPNQTLMLRPNVMLGGDGNGQNWNRFNSDGTVDFLGSNIKFTTGGSATFNSKITIGSLTLLGNNALDVIGNISASVITASRLFGTADTASYYNGSVISSSYALSASFAPTNTNITASWSVNSLTASYVVTAQTASYYGGSVTSASYSSTSSYSNNSQLLNNTSSTVFAVTGSNTFTGNQTVNNGYVILTQVSASLNFIDDAAAAAGGVPLGGLYRNGNFILIRLT